MSDRFKPASLLLALGILITIGVFLMSQCSALWQLYLAFGVIFSIGMGATYITIISTIAKWFVGNMCAPTGILSAGVGAGIVIMPPFASMLITNFG